jgi:subtilisin family serine protease
MAELLGDESEITGMVPTFFSSERDQAQGVTRWMITNFGPQLDDAVRSTPFTVPLLCAIAYREAGIFWLPLTPHKSAAEILGLMVYDASGDVAGAPRSAFPVNTAEFRLRFGDEFTAMLVDAANMARAARGLHPARIVYKGYGIFQYDLQFVRTDEDFFRSRKWFSFAECVGRAVKELKLKFEATGDIHDAVRAYNGSGPKAQQYARDVMRVLPFCEEAAASLAGPAFAGTGLSAEQAAAGFGESSSGSGSADDPALPDDGEVSVTADFETARSLANLGAPAVPDPMPALDATFAQSAAPGFDLARAKAFLEACRTSHPRVTYGLGMKVPFHGAIPGRDFTQVDCSGFVREAIRLATNPSAPFPDGSVVQHDWVRAHGFEKSTVAAGAASDGAIRIAFLRPQDAASHVGHVVLIADGRTLESHSHVGPDSRKWDGQGWQAKAFVYVLAREAQFSMAQGGATIEAAQSVAESFTVRHGRRYRATLVLTGFEQFAGNDQIAGRFAQLGFTDVVVTGVGGTRQAEGTWSGTDTIAPLDPHVTHVAELPALAIGANGGLVSAPAIVQGGGNGTGNIFSHVFSTGQLPTHHDGLLVVKMRPESLISGPDLARGASAVPTTAGLSALSFYDRAGLIKPIVRVRKHDEKAAPVPRFSAAATLMYASRPIQEADASTGIRFIHMEPGQDTQHLHTALANDPNVESVSKVPIRYLTSQATLRKPAPLDEVGIEATPPDASVLWNLQKIRWEEAREQGHFQDAQGVRVAVLDTGVDTRHPNLEVAAYHWRQPDLSRPVSDKDIIGHGTHVSGTIAALINSSISVKGICNCRLSVWKIFDDQPTFAPGLGAFVYFVNPVMYQRALIACLEDRVDVINLSIGGRAVPDPVEQSLFDQLIAAGVTICAAMGNEREQNSPTSYPAAIPGVIAVGATGLDDRVTVFSNSGNHIAVAAPGKAIWSTLPTYSGQTRFGAVIGPDGTATPGIAVGRETNYDAWDGTSMATPHVSGSAALLIAKGNVAGNKLRPEQVRQSLMASADKVPDMNGASFSPDYGAGRINLLKLLQ